jgi:hypothetical protein
LACWSRSGAGCIRVGLSLSHLHHGTITITDDAVALHNLELTGTACLLWGSDYPHDEGTYPHSAQVMERIRKCTTPEQAEAILAGNAARLYGFDLEKLAGGAAALERDWETVKFRGQSSQ